MIRTRVNLGGADADGYLGLAIVEALAEARGVSPTDVELCLHDFIDLTALPELFGSGRGRTPYARRGTVSFVVEEWVVVVDVGADDEAEVTVTPTRTTDASDIYPAGSAEGQSS